MKRQTSLAIVLLVILAVNAASLMGINSVKASTLDAFEPDGDHKQAHVIRNAEPQQHSIYPVGDADWLELRMDCESDVTIETYGPSGDTVMWLYRQDLTQIAYDDDGGSGLFSKISTHLTSAIYYIKVAAYGNNAEIAEYYVKATYARIFQAKFGDAQYDEGYSVQQTSDGGYVIAGIYGTSDGYCDAYLVKTDQMGTLQWQKTYGGSQGESGFSVRQTSDGGYVMTGITYSYGSGGQLYLVKTDSSGNLQWQNAFGGSNDDYGYEVQQTSDGGYVVAGFTATLGYSQAYIVKTGSSGNLQWQKWYGSSNSGASSVQQTSDGGYVVTGNKYSSYTGDYDVYLFKIDSNGNIQWEKTYNYSYNDAGYCVRVTSDGGYIITGVTGLDHWGHRNEYDAFLIKTDSSGNIRLLAVYGGAGNDLGASVRQTSDGGYVMSGTTTSYGSGGDAWLVKTDSVLNMQWQTNYGGSSADYGYSVQQTSDSGYVIAGSTQSFGGGSEVYLIKTDQTGYSPSYRDVIVEEGTSFIPEIVYNVLHDPCGDGSYSYLKTTRTQSLEASLSVGTSSSVGVKAEAKFLGNGVQAAGEVTVSTSATLSQAFVASYTVGYGSNQITNDAQYIGPGYGDAYFGEAWVFHYRIVDRTFMNGTTKRLMEYGPTRESRFLASATWIRNNVAEPWRSKLFAMNAAHDNYISPEEQQKAQHLATIFVTGGNPWSQEYEVTSRTTAKLEFSVRISTSVAVSCGFDIIPGTEIGATVEVKFAFDLGITLETSIEQKKGIGFLVYDDDGPDGLSIDVWYDQVFGTYMFTTNPSLTSTSNPREYSDNYAPNKPAPPTGPSSGYVGSTYDYSAVTTDPDGENVCYQFDWGDGQTTTTDWKPSGQAGSASHSWSSTGTKYVKVRAKDYPLEVWSDWSNPTSVYIRNTGGGGGGCVLRGTQILMANGKTKPVETIKPGDRITGYDVDSGTFVTETVTSNTHTIVKDLMSINDGLLYTTLTDQPIYTDHGWIKHPQDLMVGWNMYSPKTNTWITINSLEKLKGHFLVYDLRGTAPDTFIGNGILLDWKAML